MLEKQRGLFSHASDTRPGILFLANKQISAMAQKQPDITIYYLQSTRAIRPVWLLEELGVPYKLEVAPYKQEPEARRAFNAKSGSPMGKYPSIRDGDLIVHESGAIIEYVDVEPHSFTR
jgi:hypothetical protein